jgi:hypothetical protein
MEFRTTVVVEIYRVCCPDCGIKIEKVLQLPSKAPFSKRFEDAVGQACESAAARQVARRFELAASTVRAIDLRYLERWAAARRKPSLAQMGVDEIYLGKKQKFITVVSNLDSGEPVWFGQERKKETLDDFFQSELSAGQRMRITAACVDMWEAYRLSIEQWAPNCRIVYDKFHVMQHANKAIDEVRRAEFFRKGGRWRGLVKGKRWLLLSRWVNLSSVKRQELNQLFALNRKLFQGLSTQRESGSPLDVPLRRGHVAISPRLDRPTPLATTPALSEIGGDAAGPSGGHPELLSDEGAVGRSGSSEWQHQGATASRTRLQESPVPAPQSATHVGDQNRIRRLQESGLKCGSRQIPAQSRIVHPLVKG